MTRSLVFLWGWIFGMVSSVFLFTFIKEITNTVYQTNIKVAQTTSNDNFNGHIINLADKNDNRTADQLYQKVRILCWIITTPANLQKRARHVRDSWAKRCNIRLFMSTVDDENFPAIGLPVADGRDHLYEKVKAAFKYIWEHYRDKADWFMRADDDTFVVVENLRYLLKDYDPNKPIYFGKRLKAHTDKEFPPGGAGYVLSREATRRFIEGLKTKCPNGSRVDDWEMGNCMRLMNVESGDSRDDQLRERFYHITPQQAMVPGAYLHEEYYEEHSYYKSCLVRKDCFSRFPISFHCGAHASDMIVYDYLINAQVYGKSHYYKQYQKLPYEV